MLKKIEGSIPLTLLLIAAGFLAYGYLTSLLKITDFMIFCIFVLGFDLVYGHMGQLSFGHMLYLGAGAYGAGLSAKYLSPDPFLALAAGLLGAGLVGAVLGPLLVRTTGACFALLNLAFNQVGHFLILVPLAPITGGEDGLSLTFSSYGWVNFSNLTFIFFLVLAVLLAVAFLILKFESSPFGLLLKSVKENEIRVRFLGYNTYFYKWVTFILLSRPVRVGRGTDRAQLRIHQSQLHRSHPERGGHFCRSDGRRRAGHRRGSRRDGLHDHQQLPGPLHPPLGDVPRRGPAAYRLPVSQGHLGLPERNITCCRPFFTA